MKTIKDIIGAIFMVIVGVVMIAAGIVPLVTNASYIFGGNPVDLMAAIDEGELGKYEGKFVSVEVDAVVDAFATTKHTINGIIPTGEDYHYIAFLEDDTFMGFGLPAKKTVEVDRVMEETWAYLNDEAEYFTDNPIRIEGTLEKLSGELNGYYLERLLEYGISSTDDRIRFFTIDATNTKLATIVTSALLILLGAGIVLLMVIGRLRGGRR